MKNTEETEREFLIECMLTRIIEQMIEELSSDKVK